MIRGAAADAVYCLSARAAVQTRTRHRAGLAWVSSDMRRKDRPCTVCSVMQGQSPRHLGRRSAGGAVGVATGSSCLMSRKTPA